MLTYLIYLTIGWAAFALLYWLLLKGETFFSLNRFYLLGGLLISFLLPLAGAWFTAPYPVFSGNTLLPTVTITVDGLISASSAQLKGYSIVQWVWWLGIAIAGFRMLLGGVGIARLIWLSQSTEVKYIRTSRKIQIPFSFFHWILIPEQTSSEADLGAMIAHEKAHSSGKHSVDVVICELLCVVFWWHPLVYWYKNTLRTVHEYIADAASVQHYSRKQYGLLLIRHAQSGPALALVHHFFQSPVKQRLVMLTKNTSAPSRGLRYTLILPLMLLLVGLFQSAANAQTVAEPDKMPEFPGGIPALSKFLGANIIYPATARKENAQGVVVLSFIVNTEGMVDQIKVLKAAHPDLNAEAIRVVKLMSWIPGEKGGKKVNCEYTLPIKFKLD